MFSTPNATEKKPILYLVYGDDGFAMQKFEQGLLSKISDDPTTIEMNSTRLDGSRIKLEDVQQAAFALPFLAVRRIVVIHQALPFIKGKKAQEAILDLLEKMPASTALLLVVECEWEKRDWKDFSQSHWLRKWITQQPAGNVYQKECTLPNQRAMPNWIVEETKRQNGKILLPAAVELANLVGTNPQLASLEIDKLITYVNSAREIEVDDVKELVADAAPISVFEMVDAMAEGKSSQALKLLHSLLEAEDPFRVFGMIIRQFRLLLLAKGVMERGGRKEQIAEAFSLPPYVAQKLENQAGQFSLQTIEAVYQQLLVIDENIKTSQMEMRLALDLFVCELSLA